MIQCYLSLGSNQKSPLRQIRTAIQALKALPKTHLIKVSHLAFTPAWGPLRQQNFCNAMVEIHTVLSPILLLKLCNSIEKKQGRVRHKKYGPRTLDIDIILFGHRRIKTRQLTIPHPHAASRKYVFVPLLEINPGISLDYTL